MLGRSLVQRRMLKRGINGMKRISTNLYGIKNTRKWREKRTEHKTQTVTITITITITITTGTATNNKSDEQ